MMVENKTMVLGLIAAIIIIGVLVANFEIPKQAVISDEPIGTFKGVVDVICKENIRDPRPEGSCSRDGCYFRTCSFSEENFGIGVFCSEGNSACRVEQTMILKNFDVKDFEDIYIQMKYIGHGTPNRDETTSLNMYIFDNIGNKKGVSICNNNKGCIPSSITFVEIEELFHNNYLITASNGVKTIFDISQFNPESPLYLQFSVSARTDEGGIDSSVSISDFIIKYRILDSPFGDPDLKPIAEFKRAKVCGIDASCVEEFENAPAGEVLKIDESGFTGSLDGVARTTDYTKFVLEGLDSRELKTDASLDTGNNAVFTLSLPNVDRDIVSFWLYFNDITKVSNDIYITFTDGTENKYKCKLEKENINYEWNFIAAELDKDCDVIGSPEKLDQMKLEFANAGEDYLVYVDDINFYLPEQIITSSISYIDGKKEVNEEEEIGDESIPPIIIEKTLEESPDYTMIMLIVLIVVIGILSVIRRDK